MAQTIKQRMTPQIFLIKFSHSLIYLFMSFCLGYLFYAGITATYDWKLAFALSMIVLETIVLALSGWRCPLSTWAKKLGDETGNDLLSDYVLPSWATRLTVPFCSLIFISGLVVLLVSYLLRQ
jgi:heme/copper-type cytochrome/quinol oxidase subunit 3